MAVPVGRAAAAPRVAAAEPAAPGAPGALAESLHHLERPRPRRVGSVRPPRGVPIGRRRAAALVVALLLGGVAAAWRFARSEQSSGTGGVPARRRSGACGSSGLLPTAEAWCVGGVGGLAPLRRPSKDATAGRAAGLQRRAFRRSPEFRKVRQERHKELNKLWALERELRKPPASVRDIVAGQFLKRLRDGGPIATPSEDLPEVNETWIGATAEETVVNVVNNLCLHHYGRTVFIDNVASTRIKNAGRDYLVIIRLSDLDILGSCQSFDCQQFDRDTTELLERLKKLEQWDQDVYKLAVQTPGVEKEIMDPDELWRCELFPCRVEYLGERQRVRREWLHRMPNSTDEWRLADCEENRAPWDDPDLARNPSLPQIDGGTCLTPEQEETRFEIGLGDLISVHMTVNRRAYLGLKLMRKKAVAAQAEAAADAAALIDPVALAELRLKALERGGAGEDARRGAQIAVLEEQKARAVAAEDYDLAKELKAKLEALRQGPPPASSPEAAAGAESLVSDAEGTEGSASAAGAADIASGAEGDTGTKDAEATAVAGRTGRRPQSDWRDRLRRQGRFVSTA